MMDCDVIDFIDVRHATLGLVVFDFVLGSYRLGVEDVCILSCLVHWLDFGSLVYNDFVW